MTVASLKELNRLVEEGWVPYFHRGVRRWYLRKGQKREVISTQLEPYAEDLASHIPRERNKITAEVVARVVELRKRGLMIGSIAEQMDLPYRTVESILNRCEKGTLEPPNPASVAPTSKGEEQRYNLPEEVEQYVQRLALKIVAEPKKKQLPGYRNGEAYAIPVEDAETGKRLTIVYPLPTYRAEGYETAAVTNNDGKKVKVLVIKRVEENSASPLPWPLVALGVAVGIGAGATLIDRFLGPMLGWNPEGRWWWERTFKLL